MNREESWAKEIYAMCITMKQWKLPNDFWEKCSHGYTRTTKGGKTPPPYDNRRNHIKLTFREHDMIRWDNLLEGQMDRQWIAYVKLHIENENIKLQAKEWAPKMILALWDHMLQLWQYQSEALHKDDIKREAQFKVEAIYRDIERLATIHTDLTRKI
jgi:hypothetical protein